MEVFKRKTVEELTSWLKAEGYKQNILDIFQENEVDGDSFLLLKEHELKELVRPIGPRLKLSKTISELQQGAESSTADCCGKDTQFHSYTIKNYDSMPDGLEKDSQVLSVDDTDFSDNSFDESGMHDDFQQILSGNDGDTLELSTDADHEEETSCILKQPDEPPPKKRVKVQVTKLSEPPLPKPFKLPNNFSVAVTLGLNNKKLTGLARPKFFSTIASAILFHKKYPTKEEYLHVAMEISKQYPFIVNVEEDGYDCITDALKEKMKYLRNYKSGSRTSRCADSTDSPVLLHKKSNGKMKATPRQPVPVTSHEVLPDEAAIVRHICMLKKEEKRNHPNMHVVSELMIKTFQWRRKIILSENSPKVSDILKDYPSFCRNDQIIQEFNRITNNNMEAIFKEKWETLQTNLLTKAKEKKHSSTVQSLLQIAGDNLSDESKCLLAMCCLPYLLPDTRSTADHKLMISFISENASLSDFETEIIQPSIIIKGTLANPKEAFLVVENVTLTKMPITSSLLSLMAAFYVFNIHYPQKMINSFTLLECYFLNQKIPKGKAKVRDFFIELKC